MLPITRSELGALGAIAQAAGREIMEVYRLGGSSSWTKADDSPLTHADLRAHAAIEQGLHQAFPGIPVWSEEGDALPAESAPSEFFLVDPLDGTREFLRRNGEFTVNIAWIRGEEPVAGVVLAPASDELFVGSRNLGAFRRAAGVEQRIGTKPIPDSGPLRILGSRSHAGDLLQAWLQAMGRDHEFIAAGSSLKFCRLAEGAADLYPRLSPTCQWDTAAGQAVLEAAGGCVVDPAGAPLRYGPHRPLLNPHFLAMARPDAGFRIPAAGVG